jgi:gliding motility-associated-like protein
MATGDWDEYLDDYSPNEYTMPDNELTISLRVQYKFKDTGCEVFRTFEATRIEVPDLKPDLIKPEQDLHDNILYISDLAESFTWELDNEPVWMNWQYNWTCSNPDVTVPEYEDGAAPFPITLYPPPGNSEYNMKLEVTLDGDKGCKSNYELTVKPAITLEIPNAFTPDFDGMNDSWLFKNIEQYIGLFDIQVEVFTRTGTLMFSNKAYHDGAAWNGNRMQKGDNVPIGTYWYVVKIVPKSNTKGVARSLRGTITIIR